MNGEHRASLDITGSYRCASRRRTQVTAKGRRKANRANGETSKGRFVSGNPGLPGRPKGSRNLLADAMIDNLYKDWQQHGIQAIRAARENRPVEYLKVVAVIVSKCGDLSLADDMRDAAVEQFIEERRQQALAMIEKMREPQ
jgi:hypothetical protein